MTHRELIAQHTDNAIKQLNELKDLCLDMSKSYEQFLKTGLDLLDPIGISLEAIGRTFIAYNSFYELEKDI